MKTFICALIVLSLLVLGMVGNTLYVQNTLEDFQRSLSDIPLPTREATDLSIQLEALTAWKEAWARHQRFLGISLNHQDLMEAEGQLAAMIGAAKSASPDNYFSSREQLTYILKHLRLMAGYSMQTFL